ncbi:MAG: sugar phosphate nucleotidyltransferase [Muribaculaceae bacterium]
MNQHIIKSDATIREALTQLNGLSGGVMTLVVIDSEDRVDGTVTDGDIRRGLIAGRSLDDGVNTVMHRSFKSLKPGDGPREIAAARCRGIKLLPELDAAGRLVGLFDFTRCENRLPLQALLMAGGKGERLRPLTLTTPKPLLEVGGRPIIDYNVAKLARAGISDVTVSVRYLADRIRSHFAEPSYGINVKIIEEDAPLGTLGAASLIEHAAGGDTLVMNSDLLTDISLEEMFLRHSEQGADITVAAIPYTVSVPYAILATDDETNCVRALEEKPTYSYFANAGIYIFSNRLLDTLGRGERCDAPDLIERCIADGGKVIYHPIAGTWIDIGTPSDYRHANELMRLAAGRF